MVEGPISAQAVRHLELEVQYTGCLGQVSLECDHLQSLSGSVDRRPASPVFKTPGPSPTTQSLVGSSSTLTPLQGSSGEREPGDSVRGRT